MRNDTYKPIYLVMVTATENNNKYYKMIPNGDGSTWTAEYGRVGASCQKKQYPLNEWDKKYREKVKKGYVDQTDLVMDLIEEKPSKDKSKYKEIENKAIKEIVDKLQKMASKAVKDNYTISSDQVTQAMCDEAQTMVDNLLKVKTVSTFNDRLLKLFTVIPRKMKKVDECLASSKDDFPKIIKREQDLLDVMKGQVAQQAKLKAASKAADKKKKNADADAPSFTILEALGLEFEECTDSDIKIIKKSLGESAEHFSRAWKVKNLKTQEKFDKFVKDNKIKDVKLLFHGSRNENWWSIIQTGLILKPTNVVITGKMFGYGIYYAPRAKKSIGYTSLSGSYWAGGSSSTAYMALMEVAYGKPYDVYSFSNELSRLDYEGLQKKCPGANCLHAHAGKMLYNDEIIIYKEEQCTIKYLIEIKK